MEKVVIEIAEVKKLLRISFFFLTIFSLSVSFSLAQTSVSEIKITQNFKEVSLEDVINNLSKNYNLNFSFSDDVIPVDEKITINGEGELLKYFLNRLFANLDVDYKILNNRIILRSKPKPLVQTIRGKVIDEITQIPIPGASIILQNTDPILGNISDKEGKFTIFNVPVGRHTLSISCVGYTRGLISNILLNSGKELVIETKLAESVTDMEEVIVTASKDETRPGHEFAVVSARSFSVEETKRYAGSFGDPARMASGFAGVTGANDEDNALIIRGNSPRGLLWKLEGMEIPNPNHFAREGASSGIVSIISANVLDNSDFFTSAFPATYGNALSGVLDLQLRNGNNEKREYTFQAGLLGIEAAAEGPFMRNGRSSYLVNYRYSTLNILDMMGFGLNEIGQYKNYQDLAYKANFPTKKLGNFSIYGIGGLSRSDQIISSKIDKSYSDMGIVGITHKKNLKDHATIQTGLSVSGTRISNFYDSLRLNNEELNIQEQYIKTYARASIIYKGKINPIFFIESGAIYSRLFYDFSLTSRDSENPNYPVVRNFSEEENGNAGISQAFSSIKQKITPRLNAVYGIHFMHFGLTGDLSIEPRLALSYQLNHNQLLTFGAGKHSRIDNLQYYLARDHQIGGEEVQINRDLGFTRSNHYVLGFSNFFRRGIKFNTEVYYQYIFNAPIQTNPLFLYSAINDDSGFITDSLNNNGKGKNYGIEFSLEKSFKKDFYFILNGSVFESKFSIGTEHEFNTIFNGSYNFNFLTGKEFKVGKENRNNVVGLNFKVISNGGRRFIPIDLKRSIIEGKEVADMKRAFAVKYPNFFRTDCQVTYRKNKQGYSIEWRLDIQNFTNHLNPLYYYYSQSSEKIEVKNQIGWLPVFSYRVEF